MQGKLLYLSELRSLERDIPKTFATSAFCGHMLQKELPFADMYIGGRLTTVEYLTALADSTVFETHALFVEKQSDAMLPIAVKSDYESPSQRILSKIQFALNESQNPTMIPKTHKLFTRLTKLAVLTIDQNNSAGFLAFFQALNPTWRFQV
jgi:hypothetical protein